MVTSQKSPDVFPRSSFPAIYPILDIDIATSRRLDPLEVLQAWLDAGARLVQLRAKQMSGSALLALASECQRRAAAHRAIFIVNDRVDVARLAGASGVHLGQHDLPPDAARRILPGRRLIGWSTHNEAQLRAAAALPIDYVAIGPIYRTGSKARPDPVVGLDGLRGAVRLAAGRPVVAIGGITSETAPAVLAAGATTVALIGDVLAADAGDRVRLLLQLTGM